jgi:hypothetical protein
LNESGENSGLVELERFLVVATKVPSPTGGTCTLHLVTVNRTNLLIFLCDDITCSFIEISVVFDQKVSVFSLLKF